MRARIAYGLRFAYYAFIYLSSLFISQPCRLIVDLLCVINMLNKEIVHLR